MVGTELSEAEAEVFGSTTGAVDTWGATGREPRGAGQCQDNVVNLDTGVFETICHLCLEPRWSSDLNYLYFFLGGV